MLRGDSRSDFSRKEWANVTELRSDGYNVSDRYARQSLTTAHLSLRLIDKTCGEIPSLIFFLVSLHSDNSIPTDGPNMPDPHTDNRHISDL